MHRTDRPRTFRLAYLALLAFGLATPTAHAQLVVSPSSINMGSAPPGEVIETTLTIRNAGTAAAFADFILPERQFWLHRTTCMLSTGLAPGATCQALIRFSATAACTYHTDLQVHDWSPPESYSAVHVALTAAGAASAADCSESQYSLDNRWQKVLAPYPGNNPYAGVVVTAADLGSDGEMDAIIAVMPYQNTGVPQELWHTERLTEVHIYTYTSDGRFIETTSRWFGTSPLLMPFLAYAAVADFNGDGKSDIAFSTINEDGRPVSDPAEPGALPLWYVKDYAFMSTPGTAYNVQALSDVVDYSGSLTAADIDGDGDIDLVVAGQASVPDSPGQVGPYVLINNGLGTFVRGQGFAAVGPRTYSSAALADLDGDGDPDLVMGRYRDGSVAIYRNVDGIFSYIRDVLLFPGTYNAPDDSYHVNVGFYTADFEGIGGISIADLDGDGVKDIVSWAGGGIDDQTWWRGMSFIRVAHGLPGLNFLPLGGSFDLAQRGTTAHAQVLSLNRDGTRDVVMRLQSGWAPVHDMQLRNDGSGVLRYEDMLAFPADNNFGDSIHVADMNRDGRQDIVYARTGPLPNAPGEHGVMINLQPDSMASTLDSLDQYLWQVPSAANTQQQGFIRLINRTSRSASVTIWGLDASGHHSPGAVSLTLAPKESRQVNSQDIEGGNVDKGLLGHLGAGTGNWTVIVHADADVEALAYIRTPDGFLTSMHDRVEGDGVDWIVPIFNPAENPNQVSRLRLVNSSTGPINVLIEGTDDAGHAGPGGSATIRLAGLTSVELSSVDLESGNSARGLVGRLGDGNGKWRLHVSATGRLSVQSLLADPKGYLTNLSTLPDLKELAVGEKSIWFVPPAANVQQQGFVRLVNREARPGDVAMWGIDDAGHRSPGTLTFALAPNESRQFNSLDLELGNAMKASGALGAGIGSWRLQVLSDLDLWPLALVRTPDGFLTTVHDTVAGNGLSLRVPTFNPAENPNQVGVLRIVNPNAAAVSVTIRGTDDAGQAGLGAVTLAIPAQAAVELSSPELESGNTGKGLTGSLGNGSGKWQLAITATVPIRVLSLLRDPKGYLTNLSNDPRGSGSQLKP